MAVETTNYDSKGTKNSLRPPEALYGVLGHPLGHSLSPDLHTWSYGVLDVAAAYMRWDVPPKNFPGFMTAVRALPISGVSVTIPYKEQVIPYLDGMTPMAGRVGAVNTLYWEDGRLLGDNTDVTGFMEPLQGRSYASALILGAGGVARAALVGLQELGVKKIRLANRSFPRGKAMAEEFGAEAIEWQERDNVDCDLIINATPLGMRGERVNDTPFPQFALTSGITVFDLVYNPLHTRLLQDAKMAGCTIVDGLSMFLGQARAQCRLWTKKELPAREGRELLLSFLDK